MAEDFDSKAARLRSARNKLLGFHKLLIDVEKEELERGNEAITPGQFLGLLMGDERFEWLRSISKLIVKIDESFELSDGMSNELLDKLTGEVVSLFDDSDANGEFKELVLKRTRTIPEAEAVHKEIRDLIV